MALKLLLISFSVSMVSGQQMQLMGGINHPAGPQMGQGDIGFAGVSDPLSALKLTENGLPIIPPDTLVDPIGKIFKFIDRNAGKEQEKEQSISSVSSTTWLCSFCGSLCVVACGILPAYFLPIHSSNNNNNAVPSGRLNLLLSFAVGSLLGDVFLHLLPEIWNSEAGNLLNIGIWTISGLLLCFLVQKLCAHTENSQHKICAMMNLAANFIDNFTHGLAVGGSFLVSIRFGFLTTFTILIHEIPHEISDFAILMRADFNRWTAIKAQLFTALGGILGAVIALSANSDLSGCAPSWILPFTAGGFLNIALAQILPELMAETNSRENIKQMFLILCGIAIMGLLNQFLHFL